MHKRFLACLSLLCATGMVLPLQAETTSRIMAYDRMTVANIEVVPEQLPPNSSFDGNTVLQKLKTKVGDPFSQFTFDEDLKTLSDEYDRVEPSLNIHNGSLYITLKVWVRPMIRSIQWEGNEHIKTKTLQKELGIKPNTIFHRQAFNKAFHKLKEYYIKKGYFESSLQYTTVVDPKTNEVDILIKVEEGRCGKIGAIQFEGFSKDEQSELLDMIMTKKHNLLLSWMTGTGIYREEALEQDQMTITQYLQNKGYADAKVRIAVSESANAGKIAITIYADKGPIYHFGKIAFNGNILFSDAEIEKQFVARPGGIYSPQSLQMTVQNIQDLYGRKGYIEANVQYETKLSSDGNIYNVEFWITEGEQYKIGMIHVVGNAQTQAHVILRESLLIPGETFDSAKLKATQARLEGIGYFKTVNVYAVRTQDDVLLGENYRDVYIEVEETTTGNISLFFGFSTADSAFGGLDLVESNFNAAGIPYIFKKGLSSVRGGGEYLRSRASIGSKTTEYSVSWMNPYFRDSLWRIGLDVSYSHNDLQAKNYWSKAIGGAFSASYPLNSYWTFGTKYRLKHDISHVSANATEQEKRQAASSGLISAVGTSLTFDSTDSALKPRRGFRSLMEGEFAGVGGDFCFFRFSYLNSYYTPLWKKGTMKYRAELRFIEPVLKTHNPYAIPTGERFYMGGENSVRGYEPFKLGPWFHRTNDPKGGISSTLLSVEYLQNITKMLDLFVFADGGALSMHRFQIPKMRLSYGIGARIDLLNRVPMVVGWGIPVNAQRKSQVKHFFFSMGGQF